MHRAIIILLLVLAACEAEATPLPVTLPTATSPPTAPPPVRYGVVDIALLTGVIPAEIQPYIEAISSPVQPETLNTDFDIIVAPGTWPGAAATTIEIQVALVINTAMAPLNDPALSAIIVDATQQSVNSSALEIPGIITTPNTTASDITLRTRLANTGWPDGFDIAVVMADVPGQTAMLAQFERLGILPRQQAAFSWDQTHLALTHWTGTTRPETWATAEVIPLYRLPVSYQAIPQLDIRFGAAGWPLAEWQALP